MITRTFYLTTHFQGPWYPGCIQAGQAVAGASSGGIADLVGTLESHLGQVQPIPAEPLRIMVMVKHLRAYLLSQPPPFWAASFQADPEGVARRLSRWNDAILLAGWDKDLAKLPARLRQALAIFVQSEREAQFLSVIERLFSLVRFLEKNPVKIFDQIVLLSPLTDCEPLVRQLLETLQRGGTTLQIWPAAPMPENQRPDIRLFKADSPALAAEMLAAWLQTQSDHSNMILIAAEQQRRELDLALERYGLPGIGSSQISGERSILRLLFLLINLQWQPIPAEQLITYLLLPLAPIPRKIGRKLAHDVVAKQPGIGGEKWHEVIAACCAEHGSDFLVWLPSLAQLLDESRQERLPASDFAALCQRLGQWADQQCAIRTNRLKRDVTPEIDQEPIPLEHERQLLAQVSRQCKTVLAMLGQAEQTAFSRAEAIKIVELASSQGLADVNAKKKGSLYTVHSPAAILAPLQTVIWWNFTRNGIQAQPDIFSDFSPSEKSSLAKAGLIFPSPADRAARLAESWWQPRRYAREIILVGHDWEDGDAVELHPLWTDLAQPGSGPAPAIIHVEQILAKAESIAADEPVNLPTAALSPIVLPSARQNWVLPPVNTPHREAESASSLAILLKCPLVYVLHYQAGIKPGRGILVEGESLVMGNLAHRIIGRIFGPGQAIPLDATIEARVRSELQDLLPKEGATLLQPGRESAKEYFEKRLIRASRHLADFIRQNRYQVLAVEKDLTVVTPEIGELQGRVDLMLADDAGRTIVLDLKYSDKGAKRYQKKVASGQAIQLAVYWRLCGQKTRLGYFSLKDGLFVWPEDNADNPGLAETWAAIHNGTQQVMAAFREKRVTARGMGWKKGKASAGNGLDALDPECNYCDYQTLCGKIWPTKDEEDGQ
jgi:hypothetical protein